MSGFIRNSKRKPTVSVVMALRNTEPYTADAIHSVLSQKKVAVELLIADDMSNDDTWKTIKRFRSDKRVRVWRFSKKRGASSARRFLVRKALGRYVAVCDGDDRLMPQALHRLSSALDRHPEAGVSYGDVWLFFEDTRKKTRYRFPHPKERWDLLWAHVWNGGSMVRRDLLLEVGSYDTRMPCLEDYDLFLRLAERTRFIGIKGKPVYWYRKRQGSLSAQSFGKKKKIFDKILRKAIWRRYRLRAKW